MFSCLFVFHVCIVKSMFKVRSQSSTVLYQCLFVLRVTCLFCPNCFMFIRPHNSMFNVQPELQVSKNRYKKSVQHRPQASRQCFANSLRVPAENLFCLYHAWKFYAYFVETRWTTLLSPNAYEHPHEINKQSTVLDNNSRNNTSHFVVFWKIFDNFTDFFVCLVSFLASTTNNLQIN